MTKHEGKLVGLLLVMALVVPTLALSACGSGGERHYARTTGLAVGKPYEHSSDTALGGASSGAYLNDGDNDPSNDNDPDNNKPDDDGDLAEDNRHPENGKYHDKDDREILTYGHPADFADRRAIVAVVRRYYAAAVSGDGTTACSMIAPSLADAAPKDYTGTSGMTYLRGAKTCSAVMSRLFKHLRRQVTGTIAITDVRVKGSMALVFLGSREQPARQLSLSREGNVWKLSVLLAGRVV